MDKNTAKLYDALLTELSSLKSSAFGKKDIDHIALKLGFKTYENISTVIIILLEDGLIDFIRHPNAPQHNFDIYTLTGKGTKFIKFEGGYLDKRRYEMFSKTNTKFTWLRHWVWFYTALLSLLLNIYFIYKYFYSF